MELHERIKYLRKTYLKLSRKDFGRILGTSESEIANIEYNRLAKPEAKEPLLKLICKEFNINEQWLRTGEGSVEEELTADEELLKLSAQLLKEEDELLKGFILTYGKLNKENRDLIKKFAFDMLKNMQP